MPLSLSPSSPVRSQQQAWIAAPPDLVWSVLTDLASWPEWNDSVARMDLRGPLAEGTEFRWKAAGMSITSVIRVVRRPELIAWTGKTMSIRALHIWRLSAETGGTQVWTGESFDGLLARVLSGMLTKTLDEGLTQGLEALKTECERRSAL